MRRQSSRLISSIPKPRYGGYLKWRTSFPLSSPNYALSNSTPQLSPTLHLPLHPRPPSSTPLKDPTPFPPLQIPSVSVPVPHSPLPLTPSQILDHNPIPPPLPTHPPPPNRLPRINQQHINTKQHDQKPEK